MSDNWLIRIYVNKAETIITFRAKTEYHIELLISGTMKLLESPKNKVTKDKNGKNVPGSEITELVLIHCNSVNNDYQHVSRVLYNFGPNKSFDQ